MKQTGLISFSKAKETLGLQVQFSARFRDEQGHASFCMYIRLGWWSMMVQDCMYVKSVSGRGTKCQGLSQDHFHKQCHLAASLSPGVSQGPRRSFLRKPFPGGNSRFQSERDGLRRR